MTLFSLLTWGLGRDRFGLLVGALSGFLVLAPVLATGFYVLSRALERGEPARNMGCERGRKGFHSRTSTRSTLLTICKSQAFA